MDGKFASFENMGRRLEGEAPIRDAVRSLSAVPGPFVLPPPPPPYPPAFSFEASVGDRGQHDLVVDFDFQQEDDGAYLVPRAAWLGSTARRRDVLARLSPALVRAFTTAAQDDYAARHAEASL